MRILNPPSNGRSGNDLSRTGDSAPKSVPQPLLLDQIHRAPRASLLTTTSTAALVALIPISLPVVASAQIVCQQEAGGSSGATAAAMAADPVLAAGDLFGVRLNYGNYEGNSAFGASALGIASQNAFGNGENIGVSASIAVSDGGNAGGRVGLQMTWK